MTEKMDQTPEDVQATMKTMDDVSIIEPAPTPDSKRIEFSKVIIIMVFVTTLIVITFSMAFMWETGDTSPLGYLLTGMFAQAAAASSVYYIKAKRENEIKLQALYGKYMVDQADIEIMDEQSQNDEHFRNY